jgi:hypothetical protein
MLAEAKGAGGESSLQDDALAVTFEAHVEVADQPGSRWSNKYKKANRGDRRRKSRPG